MNFIPLFKFLSVVLAFGCSVPLCVVGQKPNATVIFDSDMGPDYDDVGALAVLHNLADSGYVRILATVSCNKMEKTTRLLHLLNTYYGREYTRIGVSKRDAPNVDAWHTKEKWTDILIEKYPTPHPGASESEDALNVYRQTLSSEPDTSVTIVAVGFLNNLKDLLRSKPDAFSPLSGIELVRRKVKRLVAMAGCFPEGLEYNIKADIASAREVFEKWPVEVVYSGLEIGRYIRTGDRLIASELTNHPVKTAYQVAIEQDKKEFNNSRYEMGGRASYDQTTVLAAVMGPDAYFGTERGTILIRDDGTNTWQPSQHAKDMRLIHKYPLTYIAQLIENLMMKAK
jgi:purine nucleosidase